MVFKKKSNVFIMIVYSSLDCLYMLNLVSSCCYNYPAENGQRTHSEKYQTDKTDTNTKEKFREIKQPSSHVFHPL